MASQVSLAEIRALGWQRVGVYGGSFDPLHQGHLELATSALESKKLDGVIFVVAKRNPLKGEKPSGSDGDRLALLAAGLAEEPRFVISDIELRREGSKSFTVDSLREIREALGKHTELFLLVGADALKDFLKWREPRKILELAKVVTVARADYSRQEIEAIFVMLRDELGVDFASEAIWEAPFNVSSTRIRESLLRGQDSISGLPEKLKRLIDSRGAYRSKSGEKE